MSAIIKKTKVGSREGQIFKCPIHTNGLESKNELRLFEKLLDCRIRKNSYLLDLMIENWMLACLVCEDLE